MNTPLKAEVYCMGDNADLYGPFNSCTDYGLYEIDSNYVIDGKISDDFPVGFCVYNLKEELCTGCNKEYIFPNYDRTIFNVCGEERYSDRDKYFVCNLIAKGHYDKTHQSAVDTINEVVCSLLEKDKIESASSLDDVLIIEPGWESYNLTPYLREKFYNQYINIYYTEILAGVYEFKKNQPLREVFESMKLAKDNFFYKHKENKLYKKYNINQIMTIASLVEKESINDDDKNLIASVILNRLDNKMKLQIDSSTIFAITKGHYELKRRLTFQDLKIQDSYNTYNIHGLPPGPISFVSKETIEKVLENFESDYLFYFYSVKKDKLIFSKTFKEHKEKLSLKKGETSELPPNDEKISIINPQEKPKF